MAKRTTRAKTSAKAGATKGAKKRTTKKAPARAKKTASARAAGTKKRRATAPVPPKGGRLQCDLLVIGCGIGGASTAIKAADAGLDVVIVTKEDELLETNTRWAQGGIIGTGPDDTKELLRADVERAGCHINNPKAVAAFCEEGPRQVDSFLVERLKVPFTRDAKGRIAHTAEAAHSRRRIYYKEDRTGLAIHESCIKAMERHPNIRIYKRHMAVDLLTAPHHSTRPTAVYEPIRAVGAYVLVIDTGEVINIMAKNTVLATGGIGHVFLRTSNPEGATGDGIAMAYRAGAHCINMEYVQFHPTALHHRGAPGFLITEAVRGEGAKLMNLRGRYFMKDYHPKAELAPRDVVARSIYEEISRHKEDYVLLDLSTIPKRIDVRKRFPGVADKLKPLGLDVGKDMIPVVPAAHYVCGGVLVDEYGRVPRIDNLYAVGETSCTGLHGANRLASTSLLEGLVWGCRIASYVIDTSENTKHAKVSEFPRWRAVKSKATLDPVLVSQDLLNLRATMWNYVGIVRTRKRLERAHADLNYLTHRIEKFYREIPVQRDLLELRNALIVGRVIAQAAMSNPTSLGCHYRVD